LKFRRRGAGGAGGFAGSGKISDTQGGTQVISRLEHPEPAEAAEPVGWARFSPYALTQAVREFFGPWHGGLVSTEIVSTRRAHNTRSSEAAAEVDQRRSEGTIRYDYTKTENVTTKDVSSSTARGGAISRRGCSRLPAFGGVNSIQKRRGIYTDYVLVQQEIGAGVNVFSTHSKSCAWVSRRICSMCG